MIVVLIVMPHHAPIAGFQRRNRPAVIKKKPLRGQTG